jgi:hypothetical protein
VRHPRTKVVSASRSKRDCRTLTCGLPIASGNSYVLVRTERIDELLHRLRLDTRLDTRLDRVRISVRSAYPHRFAAPAELNR